MEVEHRIEVIPVTPELQTKINELEAEGWQLPPGVVPVIVYHLARVKGIPAAAQNALGKIKIDDSKVHVLRQGQLISGADPVEPKQ